MRDEQLAASVRESSDTNDMPRGRGMDRDNATYRVSVQVAALLIAKIIDRMYQLIPNAIDDGLLGAVRGFNWVSPSQERASTCFEPPARNL
ncbi:hypothetical protein [Nonomuraea sp. NPDC049141]|uniref:hypothetical protein n=1 Tax=Nonomuraea sp. NPDC049141 TaxID=3155500 RepID=UPI0033E717B1